jgi:hypothetical protein
MWRKTVTLGTYIYSQHIIAREVFPACTLESLLSYLQYLSLAGSIGPRSVVISTVLSSIYIYRCTNIYNRDTSRKLYNIQSVIYVFLLIPMNNMENVLPQYSPL